MADTFFGFSTELPHPKDGFGETHANDELGGPREDSEIDLLNDETFGAASLDTSWEEKKTDLTQFIHSQVHGTSQKFSNQKDLSFDEAFFPKDEEEEEEEEIIEKTILQLGLDDDQDDIDYSKRPKKLVPDKGGDDWTSPPRKAPTQGNSLLGLLSPSKDIWASPTPSSSSSSKPLLEEKTDVIQKLFTDESKQPNRGISLDSIPLPPVPQPPPPAQAMTLEELEKSLVRDKKEREVQIPQATIIEKQVQETPGPPPGFALPLNTPPSGLPLRTPFGMRMNNEHAMLTQMSPFLANRFPMGPGLLPGMSPMLPPSFPLPPRFGPLGTPGPMMGRARGPSTPFQRVPWRYPPPRSQNRPRGHYQDHAHRGRDYQDVHHRPEESLNLPPSVLMTSKDKEWVVKIQLMQLMSNDPYMTDYYYTRYMERKLEGNRKKEAEGIEKTKKIVEKHLESRDYKPATFEGSLGKLSCSSVHHPRQLMDVSLIPSEMEKKGKESTQEGSKRRFLIYGLIEKSLEILLSLDDIERRRKEAQASDKLVFDEERQRRVETVFRLMRYRLHTESPIKDEDFEVLLLILNLSKGKKLLASLLPVLNQVQAESAVLYLLKGLPITARKDINQELSTIVKAPVLRIVTDGSPEFLSQSKELMKSKIAQSVLSNKFGIALCTAISQRVVMLCEEDAQVLPIRDDLASHLNKVMAALPQKAKQRNEIELRMLKTVLSI